MAYRIQFGEEADLDLHAAVFWYMDQYPGREQRFLKAVDDCVDHIARAPLGAARFRGRYRQLPLTSFPYFVVYEVQGHLVTILRVFHMRRDPRTKIPRKRAK